jgi:hypothetical protein
MAEDAPPQASPARKPACSTMQSPQRQPTTKRPKTASSPAGMPHNLQRNTLQLPEKEESGNSPTFVEIRNKVSFQIAPLAFKRYS